MPTVGVRRVAAGAAGLLAAGAVAASARAPQVPLAAQVPGFPGITLQQVDDAVAAVDVGEVPRQFDRAELQKLVLTELIADDLDRAVARTYGVTLDAGEVEKVLRAGIAEYGGSSAFQQQLIRNPGSGWAGGRIYAETAVLTGQLEQAAASRLRPVPLPVLQQLYEQQLGRYQHAHVQIVTTPDAATATMVATQAKQNPHAFPDLARRYTDDDAHRAAGGDYGPDLARGQLYAAVDAAIFTAHSGAILGPIRIEQAVPEFYVVRVLSVTDIPLTVAEPELTARALQPTSAYLQGALTAARQRAASGITTTIGSWDPGSLTVR